MRVHNEHISEELYAEFLSRLPQVSVELFLEHEGRVLLAERKNKPLRGEWFFPFSFEVYSVGIFEQGGWLFPLIAGILAVTSTGLRKLFSN